MEHYRDPRKSKKEIPTFLGKKTKFSDYRERNEREKSKIFLFNIFV